MIGRNLSNMSTDRGSSRHVETRLPWRLGVPTVALAVASGIGFVACGGAELREAKVSSGAQCEVKTLDQQDGVKVTLECTQVPPWAAPMPARLSVGYCNENKKLPGHKVCQDYEKIGEVGIEGDCARVGSMLVCKFSKDRVAVALTQEYRMALDKRAPFKWQTAELTMQIKRAPNSDTYSQQFWVTIPNAYLSAMDRVAASPLSAGSEAHAEPNQTAERYARDSNAVDHIEANINGIEKIFAKLGRTRDPWTYADVLEAKRAVDLFNEMQRILRVLQASQPIDPRLGSRFVPLAPRVEKIGNQAAALQPHLERAVTHHNQQQDAAAMALVNSSRGVAGGQVRQSLDDSRPGDAEARYQAERADDQRRHDQQRADDESKRQDQRAGDERRRSEQERTRQAQEESRHNEARRNCSVRCDQQSFTCSNRCSDAQSRCRDSCPNGVSWVSCKDSCNDNGGRCRQSCTDDGRSCKGGCN